MYEMYLYGYVLPAVLVCMLGIILYILVTLRELKQTIKDLEQKNKKQKITHEYVPEFKTKDEIFSGEKKYNPDEIEGLFDETLGIKKNS